MTTEEPSCDTVAETFVRQYYSAVHEKPEYLYRFYNADSTLMHKDPRNGAQSAETATGQEQINAKIMATRAAKHGQVHVSSIDALKCGQGAQEGVLIMLTGKLSKVHEPIKRRFVQTFFLAKTDPTNPWSFYVRNDIVVVAVKERFLQSPLPSGWRDLVILFHLKDDPYRHVCEAQLCHRHMMASMSDDHADEDGLDASQRSVSSPNALAPRFAPLQCAMQGVPWRGAMEGCHGGMPSSAIHA